MAAALSPDRRARLRRDGFVVVPGLVPRERVDRAVREINHRLGSGSHPGRDGYADKLDYLSEYVSSPAIMDLAKGPVSALAESLLGRGKVEPLSQAQIVLRFPAAHDGVEYRRLVHVDGLYSNLDGLGTGAGKPLRYSLCAGVFLSDVPKPGMGNFTAYPGTHLAIAKKVAEKGVAALAGDLEKSLRLPPRPRSPAARATSCSSISRPRTTRGRTSLPTSGAPRTSASGTSTRGTTARRNTFAARWRTRGSSGPE
ncbi:MAG: hypothetical protein M0D55_08915 [Elusimicrobiota bacterium]|nr:MAG: hypothetical protein M0D55_08915 [Elusimicrobiota bacterium]